MISDVFFASDKEPIKSIHCRIDFLKTGKGFRFFLAGFPAIKQTGACPGPSTLAAGFTS